jgi:hypothetical protein
LTEAKETYSSTMTYLNQKVIPALRKAGLLAA